MVSHGFFSFLLTAQPVKKSPPGKGNTSESPARLGESFQDRTVSVVSFWGGGKNLCVMCPSNSIFNIISKWSTIFFGGNASMIPTFLQKLIPPLPRFFWRPRNQLRSRSSTSIPLVRSNFLSLSAWRLWESIKLGYPNKKHKWEGNRWWENGMYIYIYMLYITYIFIFR